jgi:hypothetical protein
MNNLEGDEDIQPLIRDNVQPKKEKKKRASAK